MAVSVLPRAAPAACRGFTLLELVVALAIAGLLLAVVPLAGPNLLESMRYRGIVRDVLVDLRAARIAAIRSGETVRYIIDTEAGRAGPDRRQRELPSGVELRAVLAQSEIDDQGRGTIVFYPDGSSTGGSLYFVRERAGTGVRLRVDWLLGRVSQEPLAIAEIPRP